MAAYELLGIFLVAIGLVLFGIELAHPGVLLFIPGSILLAAGLMFVFLPDFLLNQPWGAAVVLVAALVAALLEIPYYRYVAPPHRPMTTTSGGFEGELGVVVADVIPNSLKGKIRIRTEIWSAQSTKPIASGTRVKVIGGEGVSVWVVPADEAAVAA